MKSRCIFPACPRSRFLLTVVLGIAALLGFHTAHGATLTWTGTTNTLFTGANWEGGSTFSANDIGVFGATPLAPPNQINGGFGSATAPLGGLEIRNAGSYDVTFAGLVIFMGVGGLTSTRSSAGAVTIGNNIRFTTDQVWDIGSGANVTISQALYNSGDPTIGTNNNFEKTGSGTLTLVGTAGDLGGTGKTFKISDGVVSIAGNGALGSTSSTLELNGGTLQSTASLTQTRAVTLSADSTIRPNSGTLVISGTISGAGGLEKQGAGTLTLSGTNTYTGGTQINAGALALTGNGTLATTGAVNVAAAGAAFDISGISASGLTIGSLAGSAGSGVTLGGKNLTVGDASSTTFAGNMTGTTSPGSNFNKVGSGTLTISGNWTLGVDGASSDSGLINVSGGEIRQTAGTVNLRRNNPNGSGAFFLGDTSSYTVSSGTLLVFNSSGTSNWSSARIGSGGAATLTINGVDASVRLGGSDNTLGGNNGSSAGFGVNSGTGTINLSAGELAVNSLATGTVAGSTGFFNFSGGTLRPYSQNTSIGASGTGFTIALSGSGATLSGLDVAAAARTLTLLTTLGGSGGVSINGGTVEFAAANSYGGSTSVSAGTLALAAGGSIASSPLIEVNSGAFLNVAAVTGGFSLASTQTLGGRGTLQGGATFVSGAKLAFDATGPLIAANQLSFTNFGISSLAGVNWDSLALNSAYTLIDGTQNFALAGLLNFGELGKTPVGTNREAYFQAGGDGGTDLQLVVVPEPEAVLVAGLGLAAAAAAALLRRRRLHAG